MTILSQHKHQDGEMQQYKVEITGSQVDRKGCAAYLQQLADSVKFE